MAGRSGAILFEALLALALLAACFTTHLAVIRHWREALDALEARRLVFDGRGP